MAAPPPHRVRRPDSMLDGSYQTGTVDECALFFSVASAAPARAWISPEECEFWLYCVEDAKKTAVRLGQGLSLPGMDSRIMSKPGTREIEIQYLLDWLVLCPECEHYVGSLPWICRVLSSNTGETITPDPIRRFVLAALDTPVRDYPPRVNLQTRTPRRHRGG